MAKKVFRVTKRTPFSEAHLNRAFRSGLLAAAQERIAAGEAPHNAHNAVMENARQLGLDVGRGGKPKVATSELDEIIDNSMMILGGKRHRAFGDFRDLHFHLGQTAHLALRINDTYNEFWKYLGNSANTIRENKIRVDERDEKQAPIIIQYENESDLEKIGHKTVGLKCNSENHDQDGRPAPAYMIFKLPTHLADKLVEMVIRKPTTITELYEKIVAPKDVVGQEGSLPRPLVNNHVVKVVTCSRVLSNTELTRV